MASPAPSPAQSPAQSATTHADDLSDALLEQLFYLVCTDDSITDQPVGHEGPGLRHVPQLPLVCRRWARVYSSSLLLWRDFALDWQEALTPAHDGLDDIAAAAPRLAPPQATLAAFGHLSHWLHARSARFQALTYTSCHFLGPCLEDHLLRLCAVAPRLRSLTLVGLTGGRHDVFLNLSTATALQSLTICGHRPKEGPLLPLKVSSSALRILSRLTNLHTLDLTLDDLTGDACELAAWSALTALTKLRIVGLKQSVMVHPDLLGALPTLRCLELSNCRLAQFSPITVQTLSSLTCLSLTSILAAKPRRKAGFTLWDALRGLLSLERLRIEVAPHTAQLPDCALACPALRCLTLVDCRFLETWLPDRLQRIDPGSTSLQELHLEGCCLPTTPVPQFWAALPALTSLTWRDIRSVPALHHRWLPTPLVPFPEGAAPVLRTLRRLRLEYCGLQAVPPHVLHECGHQLEELGLEGNYLDPSRPLVLEATGLQRLAVDNCGLAALPEGVNALRGLREISLVGAAEGVVRELPRSRALQQVHVSSGSCAQAAAEWRDECVREVAAQRPTVLQDSPLGCMWV